MPTWKYNSSYYSSLTTINKNKSMPIENKSHHFFIQLCNVHYLTNHRSLALTDKLYKIFTKTFTTLSMIFSAIWYSMSLGQLFGLHFSWIMNEQIQSWMVDEFIHWPKPYFLLRDFWWKIVMDAWYLDKNHLVSDSNCNNVNLYPPKILTSNDK